MSATIHRVAARPKFAIKSKPLRAPIGARPSSPSHANSVPMKVAEAAAKIANGYVDEGLVELRRTVAPWLNEQDAIAVSQLVAFIYGMHDEADREVLHRAAEVVSRTYPRDERNSLILYRCEEFLRTLAGQRDELVGDLGARVAANWLRSLAKIDPAFGTVDPAAAFDAAQSALRGADWVGPVLAVRICALAGVTNRSGEPLTRGAFASSNLRVRRVDISSRRRG